MYKFLVLLSFSFSSALLAQTSSSSDTPAPAATVSSPTANSYGATAHTRTHVGSVAMHYNYVFQTSPYMSNHSLMGWSVVPEVDITRHIGFQADFTALSMRGVNVDQNRLLIAAGPRYTFAPRSFFTPFVYGEGGEMRSRSSGAGVSHIVDWNPAVRAGLGFDIKSKHGIAFEIIPAEYIGEKVEWRNEWNKSFSARAGIVFNLYK